MTECGQPNQTEPIRQGDIFIWENWKKRDPWDQMGVILSADCDIAQSKLPGFFTYAPILTLQQYVSDIWATKKLKHLFNKCVEDAIKTIHGFHKRINPTATPLSQEALENWVLRKGHTDIIDTLNLSNQKEIKRITNLCKVLTICWPIINNNEHATQLLDALAQSLSLLNNQTIDQSKSTILKQSNNEISGGSHDVFFISSVPGIDELGFMVMLRYLHQLPTNILTSSITNARENPGKAIRIARLLPTFKYAMTQQFSFLFSRIGMPVEYENDLQFIVESQCEEITQTI